MSSLLRLLARQPESAFAVLKSESASALVWYCVYVFVCVCVCVSRWGTLHCTQRCSLSKTACWPQRWRPRGWSWGTTSGSRSTSSTPASKCDPTRPHKKHEEETSRKREVCTQDSREDHTQDRSRGRSPDSYCVGLACGHPMTKHPVTHTPPQWIIY